MILLSMTVDKNEIECSEQLNRDLTKLSKWAQSRQVSFNHEKSKSLYITLKSTVMPSVLMFNNQQLESVDSHKHLGITFNTNLTWKHHIDNIYLTANRKVNIFSKLKHLLDRRTLFTMYTSFIRPTLEYGSIIWNNCSELESDRLKSIQRRAARTIVGGITRTSSLLLYEESGLELLSKRRERALLLFFHKIVHDNVPSYLSEMKPAENVERHNRNLRSNNDLTLPKCRINKYKSSLLPKATSLWNELSLEVRNIVSYTSFKTVLERNIPPPNILFNIGTRKISILMAKLRMKCSLNAHTHAHAHRLDRNENINWTK